MARVRAYRVPTGCYATLGSGQSCTDELAYVGTREDGTTFTVCQRHATELRDLRAVHPDLYEPVVFRPIK